MAQELIFYPLVGMAFLVLYVAVQMLRLRYKAVRQGQLQPVYFKLNRGGKPPAKLVQVTQHYENLFELPTLFYLVVILVYLLAKVDTIYLVMTWMFFGFRVVHMYIHITENNILYRRYAFLGGVLVLYALWIRVLLQIIFL